MATHIEHPAGYVPVPPHAPGYPTTKPAGTLLFSVATPIIAAVLSLLLTALVIHFAV